MLVVIITITRTVYVLPLAIGPIIILYCLSFLAEHHLYTSTVGIKHKMIPVNHY